MIIRSLLLIFVTLWAVAGYKQTQNEAKPIPIKYEIPAMQAAQNRHAEIKNKIKHSDFNKIHSKFNEKSCEGQEPPDIWTYVENDYETEVLVTFDDVGNGTTMFVQEYYDRTNEQGVLEIVDTSTYQKINYYDKSRQMFIEYPNKMCESGGLLHHPGKIMWGWDMVTSSADLNYLYGPSALLRMAKFQKPECIGASEARGIDAYLYRLINDDGYIVDYYFAVDDWLGPYGKELDGKTVKTPLQVMVTGRQDNPWTDEEDFQNRTVVYDYIIFRPKITIDDETYWKFRLSPGLSCEDRESLEPNKKVPKIPNYWKTNIEVNIPVPEMNAITIRSKIYYDYNRKVLRVDYNEDNEAEAGIPYKEIHDYNTGIYYKINRATGYCDAGRLSPNQFGNIIGSSSLGDIIMGDPNNIFNLDDDYFFNGYQESRGLLVDAFTSVRKDVSDGNGGQYKKAVIDFLFTNAKVNEPGKNSSHSTPAKMYLTIFDNEDQNQIAKTQTIYFLGFDPHLRENEIDDFDIRDCFDTPEDRMWVKIIYEGKFHEGLEQNQDRFKEDFIKTLRDNAEIDPLRISQIDLDHDEHAVYVIMLLLEPADYLLQFKQMADAKPSSLEFQYPIAINDDENCAEACLRHQNFVCKSFFECKNVEKGCFLSNYVKPIGGHPAVSQDCSHYKRSVVNKTLPIQDANDDVFGTLEVEILRGTFNVNYEYVNENGTTIKTNYTAVHCEKQLLEDDPIFVDVIKDDFQPVKFGGKLIQANVEFQPNAGTYLDCLRGCGEMKEFRCESYSYCYDDGTCLLSKKSFVNPIDENEIVLKKNCVTLSRRHLDDYMMLVGHVSISDVKQQLMEVMKPDECAYACDEATGYTCRSFDYCRDTQMCYLHDTHIVDPKDPTIVNSTHCTHFSRNQLIDFSEHKNIKVHGERDHFFSDISVEQCAKECEDEPEYGCQGFDYCFDVESINCYLTETYYTDKGAVIADEPSCSHYSREYYDGNDRVPGKNPDKPYNPGDMAALGVSMLVISIAFSFGGVYAYNKFYKK